MDPQMYISLEGIYRTMYKWLNFFLKCFFSSFPLHLFNNNNNNNNCIRLRIEYINSAFGYCSVFCSGSNECGKKHISIKCTHFWFVLWSLRKWRQSRVSLLHAKAMNRRKKRFFFHLIIVKLWHLFYWSRARNKFDLIII